MDRRRVAEGWPMLPGARSRSSTSTMPIIDGAIPAAVRREIAKATRRKLARSLARSPGVVLGHRRHLWPPRPRHRRRQHPAARKILERQGDALQGWQCLYFLPEPQGQASLRPTLPQVEGLCGSRFGRRRRRRRSLGSRSPSSKSSSPVVASMWWPTHRRAAARARAPLLRRVRRASAAR